MNPRLPVTNVIVAAALAACAMTAACKKGGSESLPSEPEYTAPSSPPPVQMVNTISGCDDLDLCFRECDAGAADRCRRVGVSYEFGRGAPKDVKASIAWYERSCDMGNAAGCESAGRMYEYHLEPKDFEKAAALYRKSCEIGWQGGCANWAIMLENGRGTAKDLGKARELYAGACKAGAGLACERLKAISGDGG
jgi:TPR repeat protein